MDKGKVLNEEFNKVYDAISNADEMLNKFYMEHILYNKNVDMDSPTWHQIRQAMEEIGVVKCLAHDLAEHFTWDN